MSNACEDGHKRSQHNRQADIPAIIQSTQSIKSLECIDEIHDSQNQKLQMGMPMLKEELEYWAKTNYMPCQMDSVINLAVMDARTKQEREENQLTEDDFFTPKESKNERERIMHRFKIEIDDEFFNSDQQLFKSFMSMNPHAFFSFKNHSNISRTLVKHNFKPKYKSGIEKKKDEVIAIYDQDEENGRRIQKLE